MSPEQDQKFTILMEQSQAGDEKAYEELLTGVASILRQYVSRRLFAPDAVDDVVQEILLSLHKVRHTYDPKRPFGPWLYAIAQYRFTDHLRRVTRTWKREISQEKVFQMAVAVSADGTAKSDVEAILAILPDKQREAIRLLKIEELSVREASQETGFSESDIKVSAHRGLNALRRLFGRGENADK